MPMTADDTNEKSFTLYFNLTLRIIKMINDKNKAVVSATNNTKCTAFLSWSRDFGLWRKFTGVNVWCDVIYLNSYSRFHWSEGNINSKEGKV